MSKKILTTDDELKQMNDASTAVDAGPRSAMGKRNAYASLVKQQRLTFQGDCFVTLFSLLTCYSLSKAPRIEKTVINKSPPLLLLDKHGEFMIFCLMLFSYTVSRLSYYKR